MSAVATTKTLIGRINRKLAHQNEKLCKSRAFELGYHIIDLHSGNVQSSGHDVEALALELGVAS